MTRGYVGDSLAASSDSGVSLAVWNRRQWLLKLADMNSFNTNDSRKLRVVAYCDLGWRMFWGRPEPAAISGNTSLLPHFLVFRMLLCSDANKTLHDTNDDLREALENARSVSKRPRSAVRVYLSAVILCYCKLFLIATKLAT